MTLSSLSLKSGTSSCNTKADHSSRLRKVRIILRCMNKDSDFTRYSVNEIPVYQMGALDEETDFFEVLNSRGTLARFFINARISNY